MLTPPHLRPLIESITELHQIHHLEKLFPFVLDRACQVMRAQSGTLFTLQPHGVLYPEAVRGISLSLIREIPFKTTLGVSGWVATHRRAVAIEDAHQDDRFNKAVDVITGLRTRTLICVPIVYREQTLGVLQLINRIDGVFGEADLEFLTLFSDQVGVALENCRFYRNSDHLLSYTSSVINSLTGGFISVDEKGAVTGFNRSAARILAVSADKALGRTLMQLFPDQPAFVSLLDTTNKYQKPISRQEIHLRRADGVTLLLGYSTFLIRSESAHHGAAILFQDLTQLRPSS